ncbi:ninjurin-1-like [Macrobrachium rosenbergii]|uniref:ninjurin-1-like n=1 Tax=Macrobrachium rosenbergii TaxID=79674 RepID=UPI0034D6B997
MTRMMDEDGFDDEESFGLTEKPSQLDFNHVKRKMSIVKGCLDIGLLSANGNQLRNIINFGDPEDSLYYIVITSIILSLILQIASGVIMLVAEKFDINDEEEREQGERLNTVTTVLVFVVLIVNVFIAGLGVDVANPFMHTAPPAVVNTGAMNFDHSRA